MATTTTNYGFDVPQSSDLVKNGATQIALLGQDLDTFLFRPFTNNALYNSGFDIAQRGTSFTGLAGTDYTLDRWMLWSTSGGQSNYVSQQSVGNLSTTPNQAVRYCARVGRTAATTNTGMRQFAQTLETSDSICFAGQTITASYYARAGANYSAASNALNAQVTYGTGTDQIFYGFTGSGGAGSGTATLTTSWQRFSFTATVPTTATEIAFTAYWTPTGTAGAADYFEITGVQLEVGSQMSPWNRMGRSIEQELAACQRYLPVMPVWTEAFGYCYAINSYIVGFKFPVTARVRPTGISVNDISNSTMYNQLNSGTTPAAITLNTGGTGIESGSILVSATGTAATVGRLGFGASASIFFTGCEL